MCYLFIELPVNIRRILQATTTVQKVPSIQINPTNFLTRPSDRLTCKTEALRPSEMSVTI